MMDSAADLDTRFPDESVAGWLMRRAQREGFWDVRSLMGKLNMRWRSGSWPDSALTEIASQLHAPIDDLLRANPKSGHVKPALNRTFAYSGDLSPVCPLCLGEANYLRMGWTHCLAPACCQHGVYLLDCCPTCAMPLTGVRYDGRHCDCGADLTLAPNVPATDFAIAISQLLMGVPLSERLRAVVPAPMCNQPQDKLDSFLWFLIGYASSPTERPKGKRARPASVASALQLLEEFLQPVLANWPTGMHALTKLIASPSKIDSSGVNEVFQGWYRQLQREFKAPQFQWFRDEQAEFIKQEFPVMVNRRTATLWRSEQDCKGWLTASELGRALGVRYELIRSAVQAGDIQCRIHPSGLNRDQVMVDAKELSRLQLLMTEWVDGKTARALLGVSRGQLDKLVSCGILVVRADNCHSWLGLRRFSRAGINALLTKVEQNYNASNSSEQNVNLISFSRLKPIKNFDEACVLEAYRAIADGIVSPRLRDTSRNGLDQFEFDMNELRAIAVNSTIEISVTLSELCEMTGWKPEVVSLWVASGVLPGRRVPSGRASVTHINVRDVFQMLSQHLVISSLANQCSSHSRYLASAFEGLGCDIRRFENSSGQSVGLLVPTRVLGERLMDFQEKAKRELHFEKSCPNSICI